MDEILKRVWERGRGHEIGFWSNWIKTKGDQWQDDFNSRLDPHMPLQEYLIPFLPDRTALHILDVGAGPLTALGKVAPGKDLRITAVDPLADEYNDMLQSCGIKPVIETKICDAECLSNVFQKDSFDFIHVMNALDHSYDPMKGIMEMLYVLKSGCYIFLTHYKNEAEKENYSGFHQWNFCADDNKFIIWNKNNKINVNDKLESKVDLTVRQYEEMINVEILKK